MDGSALDFVRPGDKYLGGVDVLVEQDNEDTQNMQSELHNINK